MRAGGCHRARHHADAADRSRLHRRDPAISAGRAAGHLDEMPVTLPDDLEAVIAAPQLRRFLVRLLMTLPLVDRRLSAAKVRVIGRVAERLAVRDSGLSPVAPAQRRSPCRVHADHVAPLHAILLGARPRADGR